jgi:preprotein translocase SecE subunit
MVKPAETLREMADKAQAKTGQEKKKGPIRLALSYIATPFKFIGRKLAWLGHKQPFKWLGHLLWPAYFRNSWKEMKQVTWPNRRESVQLTGAVIIFAAIFGVLIAVVDFGLDKAFKQLLLK